MARELAKEKIKEIIDIIKEKPVTWIDLKENTNLPDKTLSRYLDYVNYWGLAKKSESGYWEWFERIRTYETEKDYNLAIRHSKKISEALNGILPASLNNPALFKNWWIEPESNDQLILRERAREHLKTGYPRIYTEIVEFEELLNQEIQYAQNELFIVSDSRKLTIESLLQYTGKFRSCKFAVPKEYWKEIELIVKKITPTQLEFLEETEKKRWDRLLKIAGELRQIMLQVEHGEPLLGSCSLCPTIKVRNNE